MRSVLLPWGKGGGLVEGVLEDVNAWRCDSLFGASG